MPVRNTPLKTSTYQGFTLIELMVVLVILGVLAAIGLPSFLNQANKAREAEAKTYLGSINRAQQAYYHEQLKFANNLAVLGPINDQTANYSYTINAPHPETLTEATAQPIASTQLRIYRGCVAAALDNNNIFSMTPSGPIPVAPNTTGCN
jgi:type IV pilus assembly protein PilA